MQIDITYHELDSSEAIGAAVRRWTERLAHVHDRIVACHVTVGRPHRHQRHTSEEFHVSLRLDVPGTELASTSHANRDVYVAIGDAFRAARRQLQDFVEVRREFVKPHPPL